MTPARLAEIARETTREVIADHKNKAYWSVLVVIRNALTLVAREAAEEEREACARLLEAKNELIGWYGAAAALRACR